jgi:sec-independent protein translocase protein TatC
VALSIRGRPIRLNLSWLKPPPMPPDGNMTLFEHLRELRYRLVVIAIAIVVATIVAYVFHEQLYDLLSRPYEIAKVTLTAKYPDVHVQPVIEGVTKPLTLVLKICFVAALIAASPIWIYQIWAFVVPGLVAKEKKWAASFLAAAVPLFLFGVVLAYFVIPKGIAVMMGFTPGKGEVENLLDINHFLSFLIRVMVVFGLGFEVPVFVLGLNFLGVLKAKHLAKARKFVIFGCFVFGAVATPQTDPLSMLLLAVPMTVLYIAAEIIAHFHDRALAKRGSTTAADAAQLKKQALAGFSDSAIADRLRRRRQTYEAAKRASRSARSRSSAAGAQLHNESDPEPPARPAPTSKPGSRGPRGAAGSPGSQPTIADVLGMNKSAGDLDDDDETDD